jgi:hypothetical protein
MSVTFSLPYPEYKPLAGGSTLFQELKSGKKVILIIINTYESLCLTFAGKARSLPVHGYAQAFPDRVEVTDSNKHASLRSLW